MRPSADFVLLRLISRPVTLQEVGEVRPPDAPSVSIELGPAAELSVPVAIATEPRNTPPATTPPDESLAVDPPDESVAVPPPGGPAAEDQPSDTRVQPPVLSLRSRRFIRGLKKAACSVMLTSPVFALLVLDGVDPLGMLTTVIVPMLGSFAFLLLVATMLTYGLRWFRKHTYGVDDTSEDSAATQKERSVVAAIQALPCHVVVEGESEPDAECAMCLSEIVAGDCLRTLPCQQ